jgi:hypothetical protein
VPVVTEPKWLRRPLMRAGSSDLQGERSMERPRKRRLLADEQPFLSQSHIHTRVQSRRSLANL